MGIADLNEFDRNWSGAVATKFGVTQADSDAEIVRKLKSWVGTIAPDLTPDQAVIQVCFGYNGIKAAWGDPPGTFQQAWRDAQ